MVESVKINTEEIAKRLLEEFKQLSPERVRRAISGAINETITSSRAEIRREIAKEYKIPSAYLQSSRIIKLEKATASTLKGTINVGAPPIPLMAFDPIITQEKGSSVFTKTKRGGQAIYSSLSDRMNNRHGKGITVNIKGQVKVIPSAFLAVMKSGHIGIFARGQYGADGFKFRHGRNRKGGNDLNINELTTVSVPVTILQRKLKQVIERKMEQKYEERLLQKLKNQLFLMKDSI